MDGKTARQEKNAAKRNVYDIFTEHLKSHHKQKELTLLGSPCTQANAK